MLERMAVDRIQSKDMVFLCFSNWSKTSLGYTGAIQIAIYEVNFRIFKQVIPFILA
jgi:hypothetical protein